MSNYGDILCNAISTIVEKAVNSAKYDRTIQAYIVECTDAEYGKYKVRYQDSEFVAHAINNAVYEKNALVYVLIPSNNMNKSKVILCSIK